MKLIHRFFLVALLSLFGLWHSAHADEITFFHNDAAGTPIMATNMSGAVVWSANYAPYGERVSIKSSSGVETVSVSSSAIENNAKWYVGKGFDEDTGLVYMGARYYDPRIGRFYGIDPKEVDEADVHSFNRYAYANNNPYRYVDPDGRHPLLVAVATWMGVSALIGGGTDAFVQYVQKGNVDWKQAGRASLEAAGDWPLVALGGAGMSGRTAAANAERAAARASISESMQTVRSLNIPNKINQAAQARHINPVDGRSVLTADPSKLLQGLQEGRYQILRSPKPGQVIVDFGEIIGDSYRERSLVGPSRYGSVNFGKNGVHIYPTNPNQW